MILLAFPLLSFAQDSLLTPEVINIVSYSGQYKGMNMHGIQKRSEADVVISDLMTAWSDEEDGLPRYYAHMERYHLNGTLAMDSVLDLTGKRMAHVTVVYYDSLSTMLSKTKLKAVMDPKREELPKKADLLWKGKKVVFKPEREVIEIERRDG